VSQVLLVIPSPSRSRPPIAIEELLGRPTVPPDPQLLGPGIAGQVVLLSGASGSISAELCRQILGHNPRRLVLLMRSCPSSYAINQELSRCLTWAWSLWLCSAVLPMPIW
jgi:FlaA1/EpsC-like NDP-sugar epimerase